MLDCQRSVEQALVVAVSGDELDAKRQSMSAECEREGDARQAQQRPDTIEDRASGASILDGLTRRRRCDQNVRVRKNRLDIDAATRLERFPVVVEANRIVVQELEQALTQSIRELQPFGGELGAHLELHDGVVQRIEAGR
nr:hypothetical protein [Paraburkholderia gardini]